VEDGEEYTIRFVRPGYAVIAYSYDGIIDYVENTPLTLVAAGDADFELDVFLYVAYGIIEGVVTFEGSPYTGGITIEVHNLSDGRRYTKVTARDGTYSFSLPVGDNYLVSVSAKNFAADGKEGGVHVVVDVLPTVVDFDLISKQGSVYLFGFDLTHSFMLIGGLIGLFMLIFVILYRIHIKKNPDLSKIHSDSLDKKKDQE
jgi:hypothetical protein